MRFTSPVLTSRWWNLFWVLSMVLFASNALYAQQECTSSLCRSFSAPLILEQVNQWQDGQLDCNGDQRGNVLDLLCMISQAEDLHPPVLSPLNPQTVLVGEPFTLQLEASDLNDDSLQFRSRSLPRNANLDEATGLFLFTPAADQAGVHDIVFEVSDGFLSDRTTLSLTVLANVDCATAAPTTLSSSPANGTLDVAVTRETVLQFSNPLAADLDPHADLIRVQFGQTTLSPTIHLSSDRKTIRLFYPDNLPAGARIRVMLKGANWLDDRGCSIDLDGDGQPGGQALIEFDTLGLDVVAGTTLIGRVFDAELSNAGSGGPPMNQPLTGVRISIDGLEDTHQATTDAKGNFRLEDVPAGTFFVHIDGREVTTAQAGAYYPNVGKPMSAVAGRENQVADIFLPLIAAGTLQPVSQTSATSIRFPDSVVAQNPAFEDVVLTVPAGSLFDPSGTQGGSVGIAPVPPERLPGPLPAGLEFPLVITVQTDGPENFDRPAPICFPNLPDPVTGLSLPPGAPSALWSFNHDSGRWEIRGSMTVNADGTLVCSDPGVGIEAPGWHGVRPGAQGGGGGPDGNGPPQSEAARDCEEENQKTDPVYFFSGEFYLDVSDLWIKGRGFDFAWTRRYRSRFGVESEQGHGWDFGYNLKIIEDGILRLFCDGTGRRDRFYPVPGSSTVWRRHEYFSDLLENPDGTYTLHLESQERWQFAALDGTPGQGKILAKEDRNGNRMTFRYDDLGRLTTIVDTLDREIHLTYTAENRIATVTDFIGRQITYTYYRAGDPDGSPGDLKAVTLPPIVGTPNGNDFPDGKTTTYTYSKGFADPRLNHNLLTITDPKGQTFLRNTYATQGDDSDPRFDRVIRQAWGNEDDIVDLDYARIEPSGAFAGAISRTIVNDRVGNVSEYYYDFGNRQVMMRQFTGRANADEPTTADTNRPVAPLRPEDPPFFETRYEYNQDSLRTRVIHPNGTIEEFVYESDLNPTAPARTRGNLRIIRKRPGSHEPAGDQALLEERYDYNPNFGCSSCGFNFITRHVDSRGNETLYEYDDRGNRIRVTHRIDDIVEEFEYNVFGQLTAHIRPDNGHGIRRRDEYRYADSGPTRGYLTSEIEDAEGLALTKTLTRDAVGNVLTITNPRGHTLRTTYNAYNQVIEEISAEVTPGSNVRYTTTLFYDANDNVIRRDIANIDADGAVNAQNPVLSQLIDYEILNQPIRFQKEIDEDQAMVTEQAYDANRNIILTRYGEATNGNQPAQTVTTQYDERDLVFRTIVAQGHPDQSTEQLDYDGNRNIIRTSTGLEDTPRIITQTFDGFNRPVSMTDTMGNRQQDHYDANSNVIRSQLFGELLDQPGDTDNVLLSEQTSEYDEMDRRVARHVGFFESESQTAIDDGQASTFFVFSPMNELLSQTDDNGHTTHFAYDSATRLLRTTQPNGHTTQYQYDGNDNIIAVIETELDETGGADQVFTNRFEFDGLNRQISHTDNVGNRSQYGWDSRDNRTRHLDKRGNLTLSDYDGLNRPISQTKILTNDGTGQGQEIGRITTRKAWDDANRLIREEDANGNVSTYAYDPLGRQIRASFADDTSITRTFDVHGNTTRTVDANGSLVTYDYDLNNREIRRSILPGPGVAGQTTFETRLYDGLSRLVEVEDDDSLLSRDYDSLGHILVETLNGQTSRALYDGEGNMIRCTYPSGRTLTRTFNPLNIVQTIEEADTTLARFAYVGPIRLKQLDLGNDTRVELTYNGRSAVPNQPNDFGERRIQRILHSHRLSAEVIDDRVYTWDREHNKTMRRNQLNGEEHHYRYDSIDRMVASETTGQSPVTYDFDQVHNRRLVTGHPQGGVYDLNSNLPEPGDAQMNQYSATPFDRRNYDDEGNLIRIETALNQHIGLTYDYRNQLVTAIDQADGTVAHYAYDVLGRRIERHVDSGTGFESTLYFYQDFHVIEEQDDQHALLASYVYGFAPDQLISMRRDGQDYYYHADDLGNVISITDDAGSVIERYDYEDYGLPVFFDDQGQTLDASTIGNPYLFNGRRFDPETGFYYYRTRYLDPKVGRFISRDTIGTWGDPVNLGNSFAYVGNNPWSRIDPMGEALETGWDVASFSLGLTALAYDYQQGNYGWMLLDAVGLMVDGAAAMTPMVPGGVGAGINMGRGISYAEKLRRTQIAVQSVHATIDVNTAINSYRDPCATWTERALNTAFATAGLNGMRGFKGPKNKGTDIPPQKTMCFVPGTEVLMADGSTKAIETIRPGDYVLADDPEDDLPPQPVAVLGRVPGFTLRFFHLHIDEDGDLLADGMIAATGEHPFYTEHRDWVFAEQLRAGDTLLTDQGCPATVVFAEPVIHFSPTYNLDTADLDTFFVMVNGRAVLVHNNNPKFPKKRKIEWVPYGKTVKNKRKHHAWFDAWMQKAFEHVQTKDGTKLYKGRKDRGFPTLKLSIEEHDYIHNKVQPKWEAEWKKRNPGKNGRVKISQLNKNDMDSLASTMLKSIGYPNHQIDEMVRTMVKYLAPNVKCK